MTKMSCDKKPTVVKCSLKSDKKQRREVQVVTCPSDFPQDPRRRVRTTASSSASACPGQQKRRNPFEQHEKKKKQQQTFLDWNETAREVRTLGSQAFMGKEKREYQQEEYMRLTGGRKEKQQRVPLPIQRGIKKKAAKRLERQREEARQAGIILPTDKKEKQRVTKDQGPAPSVGYMKRGVLHVKGAI
jgi:hypothetical protein